MHLADPTESGWRVVNVMPSQEEFEAFAASSSCPPPGRQATHPQQITFFPVHTLIRT